MSEGSGRASGAILGPSWPILGRSWGLLGPSWAILGGLGGGPGSSWAVLGRSWSDFWSGPIFDHVFNRFYFFFGRFWSPKGCPRGGILGAKMEPKSMPKRGRNLRAQKLPLGPSWNRLGAVLGRTWAILARLGAILGRSWAGWGSQKHCFSSGFSMFFENHDLA